MVFQSGWSSLLSHRSLVALRGLTDPNWTNTKRCGRATRTTVLSETQLTAGLMLFRVLRGGLEYGKYLGMTADRANNDEETAPRTLVPDPRAVGEGNDPTPRTSGSGLARRYRQVARIKALSCLPQSQGDGGQLAGEGHPRQWFVHPPATR